MKLVKIIDESDRQIRIKHDESVDKMEPFKVTVWPKGGSPASYTVRYSTREQAVAHFKEEHPEKAMVHDFTIPRKAKIIKYRFRV